MENMIHLSVVTADGVALDTQVSYVNIPTGSGSVGVLHGHAPMLCAVSAGKVRYTTADGGSGEIEVGDGVANAGGSEVTLLVSETKSYLKINAKKAQNQKNVRNKEQMIL